MKNVEQKKIDVTSNLNYMDFKQQNNLTRSSKGELQETVFFYVFPDKQVKKGMRWNISSPSFSFVVGLIFMMRLPRDHLSFLKNSLPKQTPFLNVGEGKKINIHKK